MADKIRQTVLERFPNNQHSYHFLPFSLSSKIAIFPHLCYVFKLSPLHCIVAIIFQVTIHDFYTSAIFFLILSGARGVQTVRWNVCLEDNSPGEHVSLSSSNTMYLLPRNVSFFHEIFHLVYSKNIIASFSTKDNLIPYVFDTEVI